MRRSENWLIYRAGGLGDHILTYPSILSLKALQKNTLFYLSGNMWYFEPLSLMPEFKLSISCHHAIFRELYTGHITAPFFEQFSHIIAFSNIPSSGKIQAVNPVMPIDASKKAYQILHDRLFTATLDTVRPPKIPLVRQSPQYLLIHPSSGSPRKNIAMSSFLELAQACPNGITPLFLFGEADPIAFADFRKFSPPWSSVISESQQSLFDLLRKTAFFIGNDSGISHLAAACGIPGLAFFRSTEPKIWGPENQEGSFRSLSIQDRENGQLCDRELTFARQCLHNAYLSTAVMRKRTHIP